MLLEAHIARFMYGINPVGLYLMCISWMRDNIEKKVDRLFLIWKLYINFPHKTIRLIQSLIIFITQLSILVVNKSQMHLVQ